MSPYNATLARPWLFCLRVIVFLPPHFLCFFFYPHLVRVDTASELIHFLGHHLLCASLAGRLWEGWGCVVTCSARRLLPPGIIFHWTLHASTERVWRKGCLSSISTSLIWFSVLTIGKSGQNNLFSIKLYGIYSMNKMVTMSMHRFFIHILVFYCVMCYSNVSFNKNK